MPFVAAICVALAFYLGGWQTGIIAVFVAAVASWVGGPVGLLAGAIVSLIFALLGRLR